LHNLTTIIWKLSTIVLHDLIAITSYYGPQNISMTSNPHSNSAISRTKSLPCQAKLLSLSHLQTHSKCAFFSSSLQKSATLSPLSFHHSNKHHHRKQANLLKKRGCEKNARAGALTFK
jgi:hypothetical protein